MTDNSNWKEENARIGLPWIWVSSIHILGVYVDGLFDHYITLLCEHMRAPTYFVYSVSLLL